MIRAVLKATDLCARQPEWVAAVLGVGLVPVATELTSYYYAMLLVFAFLWPRRPEIGVALCTLSAVTLGIAAVATQLPETALDRFTLLGEFIQNGLSGEINPAVGDTSAGNRVVLFELAATMFADHPLIGQILTALGGTSAGTRAEHWFREIARTVPAFTGMSYQSIGDGGQMIAGAVASGAPEPPGRRPRVPA